MKTAAAYRRLLALLLLLYCAGCTLPLSNRSPEQGDAGRGDGPHGGLSAENRYAGEVLAYMMRVVLGRAGDLEQREAWRRQGLGQPLDLDTITATMARSERSKGDLMVVDASLIGLSEVLYDYNPRLNLFKGRHSFHSPYPSAELIALRLLLLGKLARGETLSFSAIERHEADLVADGAVLPPPQLEAMGLRADEAALLQAVFQREPVFRWYWKSPPLVAAMDAMGVFEAEASVARRVESHSYAAWRMPLATDRVSRVVVVVLPSMVPGFRAGADGALRPSDDYIRATALLRTAIMAAVNLRLGGAASGPIPLEINIHRGRPFTVHPLNAERQLATLCPGADLAVIVLGRNVYRAMAIDNAAAAASRPRHWYLDILDVKYGHAQSEVEAIADAVVQRLQSQPPAS